MKYHQTLRAQKDHGSGTYPALILQRKNQFYWMNNNEVDKKRKKNEVRTQRKVEKQMYDAAPSFARKINEHQIKQFSQDLKAAKTKN